MPLPERVLVGKIASAHGIKGQVKVRYFTEGPQEFLAYPNFTSADGKKNYTLKKHGIQGEMLIVSIDGITDRNQAELLRGTELYTSAGAIERKENQWSYRELTGLEARLENGKSYGKVIGVHNFGAGDLIDIELPTGKTEMLPFNDQFTGEVHVEQGYLVVLPPDYVEANNEEVDE